MRDQWFIRGPVPMTKSEVRAVSLSKLELKPDSILYDVGGGTGSVSVEASRQLTTGRIYSIDDNPEAVTLMKANREKFHAQNMEIVRGKAPSALVRLPEPTHVFLGGSGGALKEILDLVTQKNPKVRVVMNAIALETVSLVLEWLKDHSIPAEIVQLQVSKAKTAGTYHMMLGENPVFVISFGGEE